MSGSVNESTLASVNTDLFNTETQNPNRTAETDADPTEGNPENSDLNQPNAHTEKKDILPGLEGKNRTLPLTDNALKVLRRRYLKKNDQGEPVEEPEQMFRRVARYIAEADELYKKSKNRVAETEEKFYNMMTHLEFMPNSPTLMNAGRELGQLSACFVLPVEDSMNSIFESVKHTALIHKSGGGTGFSFSRIRPQNDIVRSTKGVASGPVSFMHVFDEATETVKQGGTRRGANMAILRVDHPDIETFIDAKAQDDKLNNFNISVAITDAFWKALEHNREYDLINPHDGQKAGKKNAKTIFDKIVNHAWKNGDPGVIFIDRINKYNPTPQLGEIESTNPCGEQPLLPYESCNLGSINLARMLRILDNGNYEIDWDLLLETTRTAVHFLDNVIDMNKYPLPQIDEVTRSTRKIGLGVMGFADLLLKMEVPYNSDMAIEIGQEIMQFIDDAAKRKSQELAEERGPFPTFGGSIYDQRGEPPIRNATRTTIAPTGTISIIAGCSSGIEPLFALAFIRNVMDNDKLPETHPCFEQRLKEEGLFTDEIIRKVAEKGHIGDMNDIPEKIRNIFVTSHEISPEWHVRMQAGFQNYTNNAVSKTVNFANTATVEDVEDVYRLAYELGCKGVTIYRDGSRDVQVLNKGSDSINEARAQAEEEFILPFEKNRPRTLTGFTTKLNTGQGSLYVTINKNESDNPVEVFANIGKSGGDTAALAEAIGRLISIALQKGVKVEEISETLIGITGSRPVWNEGILIKSVPDGIGQILLSEATDHQINHHHLPDTLEQEEADSTALEGDADTSTIYHTGPECPECHNSMETESGCAFCRHCGYSHCA